MRRNGPSTTFAMRLKAARRRLQRGSFRDIFGEMSATSSRAAARPLAGVSRRDLRYNWTRPEQAVFGAENRNPDHAGRVRVCKEPAGQGIVPRPWIP